ncbi:serine/threonine-protein kinase [Nocardia sp. NPDC088792]|uniref:serine/threonine-protein kinase n=1 Tax=Nocardia sp. NPDC088792 TaxID=3364332 RepID=UPI0037FE1518
MHLRAGVDFAGYRIIELLGSGGMGSVYLAHHYRLDRVVALKVLGEALAADDKARIAFEREAMVAARLDHPNIVPVYDRSNPDDPALWLSMRHIEGGDAAKLLRTSPGGLHPERAVRLITDAANALDYSHGLGVLHRDVKPANLLMDVDPRTGERAVLTDFGIARTLDDTVTLSAVPATLAYAAPERFSDEPTDHRADIYSLGCTLFQMLTGRQPFLRADQAALIAAHLTAPPPSAHALRPELPVELDDVIATALAKLADDRYDSCLALAEAAGHALGTVGSAPKVRRPNPIPQPPPAPGLLPGSVDSTVTPAAMPAGSPAGQPGGSTRRNRILAALSVIGVVALATTAAVLGFAYGPGDKSAGTSVKSSTTDSRNPTATTTSTASSSSATQIALEAVNWGAAVGPMLNCGGYPSGEGVGTVVKQVSYADPAPDTHLAIVLANCDAGAGSPPANLMVFDRADSAKSAHLLETLMNPKFEAALANSFTSAGTTIQMPVYEYSSAGVPNCCPDKHFTVKWEWQGTSYDRRG